MNKIRKIDSKENKLSLSKITNFLKVFTYEQLIEII